MKRLVFVVLGALLLGRDAYAVIDPECMGMAKPADYDEQVQQDFLSNYFALVTSMSAIHGPIPHESGRGGLGLDLLGMPPLSCEKRYAQRHYGHRVWRGHHRGRQPAARWPGSCGHAKDGGRYCHGFQSGD